MLVCIPRSGGMCNETDDRQNQGLSFSCVLCVWCVSSGVCVCVWRVYAVGEGRGGGGGG